MIKIVRRGLTSLEELDRVKAEEAFRSAPVTVVTVKPSSSFNLSFFSDIDLSALGFNFSINSTRVFISSSLNT